MIIYIFIIFISFFIGKQLFKTDEPHGPNSNNIKKYVYEIEKNGEKKYYKFVPKVCICPSSKNCVKNK